MDAGKQLADEALYDVASSLNEHSDADIVIGLRSQGRAFRRSVVLEAGGFVPEAGTQIEAKLADSLRQRGVRIYATSAPLITDQTRMKRARVV